MKALPGIAESAEIEQLLNREVKKIMARKVIKTAKMPFEIKPQKESVWVCMCGLSKNQPFCDGSHKAVQDEPEDELYEYDPEGHRQKVGKL